MDSDETRPDEGEGWKSELLQPLMAMGFERLAQWLLREADFISVNVTGRSGDGGIDGLGIYPALAAQFFQCKRYHGSVGPGAVRDFRGAMATRPRRRWPGNSGLHSVG